MHIAKLGRMRSFGRSIFLSGLLSVVLGGFASAAPQLRIKDEKFDLGWEKSKEIKPGTCYEASPVAAIRRLDPDALKRVFKWNDDGSLAVNERNGKMMATATFYTKAPKTGEYHPVEVSVDLKPVFFSKDHDKIVERDLKAYTADVLVLEAFKSFRLSQGKQPAGWARVASGGMANRVMSAILGGESTLTNFSATASSAENIWEQITTAEKERRPVVAGTSNAGTFLTPRRLQGVRQGLIEDKKIIHKDAGVVDTHAYTVVGTMEKEEIVRHADGTKAMETVRYVRLRNPWGNRLPPGERQGYPGTKRGFVDVPLKQFTVLFEQLYVGPKIVAAN